MKANILFHEVEYWFNNHQNRELSGIDEEHIRYMINEGYSSGELSSHDPETDEDLSGWWQIKGFETQTKGEK